METQLRHIEVGDPAVITLMAHPDKPLAADLAAWRFDA